MDVISTTIYKLNPVSSVGITLLDFSGRLTIILHCASRMFRDFQEVPES